jgi:hypothetical protein
LNGAPGWWPRAGPPNPFDCFEAVLAEPLSATSEEFFARYPVPVFFEASGVGVRRAPSAGRESALAHRQPGVPATDTVGLRERVGAEYAGAVQILPKGVVPGAGHVRRLSNREITTLVADLPTYHLPDGATPQSSLAGVRTRCRWWRCPAYPHRQRRCGARRTCRIPRRILLSTVTDRSLE